MTSLNHPSTDLSHDPDLKNVVKLTKFHYCVSGAALTGSNSMEVGGTAKLYASSLETNVYIYIGESEVLPLMYLLHLKGD